MIIVAYTGLCKYHPNSGKEADIGLSDYISLMSQPAYIMKVTIIINTDIILTIVIIIMQEKYEFPRLYSWTKKAKQSVFALFNYMENASFRGDLKVTIIITINIIIIIITTII